MTGPHKQTVYIPPDRAAEDGPTAPIRRKLGVAFGAVSLVLLLGIVSLLIVWQLVTAFTSVSRSTHISNELRQVTAGFSDAESGLRGYVLTGGEPFLVQYQNAIRGTRLELEHVFDDARSIEELRVPLLGLRRTAEQKFAAMDTLSFVAVTRGRDEAASLLRAGLSQDEMDSVRVAVAAVSRVQQRLLAEAASDRDRNTRLAAIVIAGATVLAFLLLVAVMIALRREVLHEAELQKHLIEQTQRLDAQTTELELQNEQLQDQAVALEEQSSELEAQQTELESTNDELVKANSEIESSRERLRLLLESADMGMYGLDPKGRCSFINPAGARMLGYSPEDLIGKLLHQTIHHTRADNTPYPVEDCPIHKALVTGIRVRRDDEVYWRGDRTAFPVDYTAAPMTGADGVHGVVVSFFDISARKREEDIRTFLADAATTLSASLDYRETLRTVVKLAVPRLGDWCAVDIVENGKLERLAMAHRDEEKLRLVEELTRRRPPSLTATIGSGHVVSTGRAELIADLPEELLVASAEGDVEAIQALQQLELRSYLGVPLVVHERAIGAIVCVMAESGRRFTEHDLHVAQDLAARASLAIENSLLLKEAEDARKRAESADHAKTQFLAAMSHELRTPLNAIAGYAELIAVGVHGPVSDKQREALSRITRSQKTLLSLINDILNFSKLQAGYVQIAMEDVQLAGVLGDLDGWIEPQLRTKQLRYHYNACPAEVWVRGDREKIQQIMLNLLSNAVKFTPAGGSITVTCAPTDGEVKIEVTDTGPGIPAEKVDEIFEPFVQIDRGVQSQYQGTGLGLAISRDLARAMHGDITVPGTSKRGATFVVRLPRARPQHGGKADAATAGSSASS